MTYDYHQISNDLTKSDQQNQISAVTKFALPWIGLSLLASMVFPLYIGHLSQWHPCSYLLFTDLKKSHLIKTQDEWHWPFCQWALGGSYDGIMFLQVHIVKCHIRDYFCISIRILNFYEGHCRRKDRALIPLHTREHFVRNTCAQRCIAFKNTFPCYVSHYPRVQLIACARFSHVMSY